MNLAYAHKLLVAADEQPHGFLQIRGRQAAQEVRLMVAAGLVEATLSPDREMPLTAINRVTDLGHAFLRDFKDSPVLTTQIPNKIEGMAGEWDLNP